MIASGSLILEMGLWILFIIPGLIYSLYRLASYRRGCRICGGALIPVSSPRGMQMVNQFQPRQFEMAPLPPGVLPPKLPPPIQSTAQSLKRSLGIFLAVTFGILAFLIVMVFIK